MERLEKQNQRLKEILSGNNLGFFIVWQSAEKNPRELAIGLKKTKSGMWLFDAISQSVVERLRKKGVEICENQSQMILEKKTATISEVSTKLGDFIKRFYPEVAKEINRGKLKPTLETNQKKRQK